MNRGQLVNLFLSEVTKVSYECEDEKVLYKYYILMTKVYA